MFRSLVLFVSLISMSSSFAYIWLPEMIFMQAEDYFSKRTDNPQNSLRAANICKKLAKEESDQELRTEYLEKEGEFKTYYLNFLIKSNDTENFCELYEQTTIYNQPYDKLEELYLYSPYPETLDNLINIYKFFEQNC